MKKLLLVCLVFLMALCAFAAQYHTVPVEHEVYRIIDTASIRGIIPTQTAVKPYSLSKVRGLLGEISASERISAKEKKQISLILDDFDRLYGKSETSSTKDVLSNVFYRTSSDNGSTITLGLKLKSVQTVGYDIATKQKVLDSRNGLMYFSNGDLFNFASYDINLAILYERLAPGAFLLTDFTFDGATYQTAGDEHLGVIGADKQKFFMGFQYEPELSTSLFNDKLSLRYATVRRDWGIGVGNFQLSRTAGTIDAVEMTMSPVNWFDYSVMFGSLGKMDIQSIMGVDYPSDQYHEDNYNNNITAHKLEIRPLKNVDIDVWESVVYRKRFELGYLNPLGVYMFAQNAYSDFDNVIAGADVAVNLSDFQFYAGIAMDEIGSVKPKMILKHPRNLISYQAGVKFAATDLSFSKITAQMTYVPAFFGSHYGLDEKYISNPAGFTGWKTSYVNKGHLIGYPVNPDTLELLIAYDGTLGSSLNLNVTVKDQIRSYQYATHDTGTDILDSMKYSNTSNYKDRAFFKNIAQNTVDFEINAAKKFYGTPVSLTGSLQFIIDSNRAKSENNSSFDNPNYGDTLIFGDWSTSFNVNAGLGVKINY